MALPSGYTQLNYIQSSGTQYINTGFTPTANTRLVMDFQLTTAGTGNNALFAVVGQFSFRWYGSGSKFRSNGSNSVDFPAGIDGTARHTVEKTATSCTLDGENTVTNTAGTVSNPLYLLAQNTGSGVSNYASAKLYSCKIYENGSLVRNFVPAMQGSTVGLYDAANGVFYTNAGSGTFTSGGVFDPTAPVGDHNTLIDGTAREIESGSVMVDGTVYEIEQGYTLVNGTVHVIEISLPITTVTITGRGNGTYAYVTIDGTKYTQATTLEVPRGTSIRINTMTDQFNVIDSSITFNGNVVAVSSNNNETLSYEFAASTDNVNIALTYTNYKKEYYTGYATITTS